MLQVKNATPFEAKLMLLADTDGIDTVFTVVKGTFTIGAAFGLAERQVPVNAMDQHHGEPAASSIKAPSDVSLEKPGTDVLLVGSAWAPGGAPTWYMDASLSVGPLSKTVRVFADRVWDDSGGMTWQQPFARMPLVWERAFGGSDETEKGPAVEARNPVGTGFRARNGAKPLGGLPLPNVEDPSALISSWRDAPTPAGFAPVAPHWMPRRTYAGTYDEAWQQNRAPYLPTDFDRRFCQVAPPGLSTAGHLQGGEPVELRGVTPSGSLRFPLPVVRIQATYRIGQSLTPRPAALETVLLEPDEGRMVMVWRAALPCDKQALKVRDVEVELVEASWAVSA